MSRQQQQRDLQSIARHNNKKSFYDTGNSKPAAPGTGTGAGPGGGDTGFRRTWDKDEYARKAHEREGTGSFVVAPRRGPKTTTEARRSHAASRNGQQPLPPPSAAGAPQAPLRHRDAPVDFTKNLNKTTVVQTAAAASTAATPAAAVSIIPALAAANAVPAAAAAPVQTKPGFFCPLCNVTCMDNVNYLDHLNSAKHQRNLGMSMKVERSTADQVRKRIEELTRKRKEPVKELNLAERVQSSIDAEEAAKHARKAEKKRRKEEKRKEADAHSEAVPISTLGDANAPDGSTQPDQPLIDVAAFMGFGGFGSSKK
ncbi:zinc finger, matrin-type 2 [Entophlyctis luteolus]|nr:zinc finger, matrin-type 2 [Entophlyctis luteolus]